MIYEKHRRLNPLQVLKAHSSCRRNWFAPNCRRHSGWSCRVAFLHPCPHSQGYFCDFPWSPGSLFTWIQSLPSIPLCSASLLEFFILICHLAGFSSSIFFFFFERKGPWQLQFLYVRVCESVCLLLPCWFDWMWHSQVRGFPLRPFSKNSGPSGTECCWFLFFPPTSMCEQFFFFFEAQTLTQECNLCIP